MPELSIIIPTLNEEKLLAKCLGQFTPEVIGRYDIEVIVSDGGSADKTLAIASQYADHVLMHEEPSRQTIAEGRNKGAKAASGKILIFVNADTTIAYPENFFATIRKRFSGDPKLAALAVKVEVDPGERIFSDTLFHGFFNTYVRLINMLGIAMGRGECQIIRSSVFAKAVGYNQSLAAGEDYELYKRLKKIGKVSYDPKLLIYESPRRYRKFGYGKVYSQWIRNAFSVLFKKRSSSEVWEEVR